MKLAPMPPAGMSTVISHLVNWSASMTPRVSVNGKVAKPGTEVKEGDIIEIGFGTKSVRVEVLAVMETTRKEAAADLYRYL